MLSAMGGNILVFEKDLLDDESVIELVVDAESRRPRELISSSKGVGEEGADGGEIWKIK